MTTSNSALNPVFVVLGRLLETTLNALLQLDKEALERVRMLEGRAVTLEFRGSPIVMRIQVYEGRLNIGPAFAGESGLHLRAAVGDLLVMAIQKQEGATMPTGKVEISGDAGLARQLENLLKRFQPDIEEAFSQVFWDVAGYQIVQTFQKAFHLAKEGTRSLLRNSAEYLQEDSRDLVAPAEMQQFLEEVDDLQQRGERLEKRFKQIQAFLKGGTG